MSNEFIVKNGLIVGGNVVTSGTITINGALAATQSWVTSQAYLTSASLSGYATQSYVTSAIASLVDSAPAALDTLKELATALGNDASFATTVTNSIASKLSLSGGTMTGQILFQTSALNNGFRWDVNSDAAGITFKNTGDGDNNSYFNFFTEDNGNEYFKFSHNTWNIGSFDFMDVKNGVIRTNGDIYVNASQSGTRSAGTNELINGSRVWHAGDFSSTNISNWNTAYSWGNHASVGYLTTYTDTLATVTGRGATTSTNISVNTITIGTDATYGAAYRSVSFGYNGDGSNRILAANNTSDGMYFMAATGQGFNFRPNGGTANLVVINSTGNVGIGTTSPAFKTTISADITKSGDINPGTAQLSLEGATTPGKRMILGYDTNSNGFGFIKAGNYGVTWTSLSLQPDGGNVGIGTTSPNYKLDVAGFINIFTGNGLRWGSGDAEIINSGYNLLFKTYNGSALAEAMRINSAGKVSIGTTDTNSDKSDFTVYTGGNTSIALAGNLFRVGEGDINWDIALRSNGFLETYAQPLYLRTIAGSQPVVIGPNGTNTVEFYPDYTLFNGLNLAISRTNSTHGATNYFRGDASHLVIGTGGTLYLNYGGSATNITGNVTITGGIGQNNLVGRPYAVWGAGGTTTGAVVIKFPGNTSNYGMVHAVIDIYEYNGNTVSTVIVGGHNWGGSQWYNYGANLVGQTDKQVRVAVVDGAYAIVIGDNSSSWSYGQVVLRKIQNGSYYANVMNVSEGYTITQTASLSPAWISGDLRQLTVSGVITASGGNSNNWNTAHSWGNHATAGYLTSYSETDTLASVTGRGATTTTPITVRGITATKDTNQITINRVDGGGATWQFYSWPGGLNIFPNSQLPIFIGRDGSVTDFSLWNGKLLFENKNAIEGNYDSWLRLNNSNHYTSGVYTPGVMRADGGFNVSGNTVWHAANDGSGSGLDADLLDGQNSTEFLRLLSGGAEASLDSYTDNGVRSVSFAGHSQHLLSWNAGGSTGTVQQLFHYGTPNNGWRIRNKTDNSSWSDWGYVVMASSNQGLISGTIATQSWVGSQSYATTSYVTTQINNLINGAPGVLDTLDELAAALGDDANFATTVTNSIAGKVSKSGDTMTGNLTLAGGTNILFTGGSHAIAGNNTGYLHFYDYTNVYFNNQLVIRGGIQNDGGNVLIDDNLNVNGELAFPDGAGAYSNIIRSAPYPSEGYPSGLNFWMEYRAKGGHHFILNTDGGVGAGLASMDDFVIWQGAIDGNRLLEVSNIGNLWIAGALTESSSLKLKENVQTSEGNLEKVVNLRPVTYNKIGSQTTELGLIAEEVAEVYPEFVQYDENGEPVGVHYSRLTAALIGAVKELTNQVQELNKKING